MILEDEKRADSKVMNRNTRQNEQYTDTRKKVHKYFDKKKFKSKLEQMEIAYNNNTEKKFIKRVVKKGFQTRHITDYL